MNHKFENQYDGFLDLDVRSNGTYIVIYAPNEGGKRVTFEQAVDFLKIRDITQYNSDVLREAVDSVKDRKEVKISLEKSEPSMDEEMGVELSKNKMFAIIHFFEPQGEGKMLSKDDILEILNKNHIVYGINHKAIDELLENKKYRYKYIIAKGKESVNGKNGALKFYFDVEKKSIKPKIGEDGSIDFKNLDLIEMTKEGQKLVSLIPPVEGKSGKNVLGEEIPTPVYKSAVLPKGKNVKVSEDGSSLIAEIEGQISYTNGKVNVYSTYEVAGNVDNSTGNIDFLGNVIVKGNVLTGFNIKAGGSIEVHGVVEGAELEADGDIILYRGMQGVNRGVLISNGNITAKYIENSSVKAHGDIQSNAIMHSEVKAGGSIILEGKKGLLVGGNVKAGVEIFAKTIGSPMATATEIEVGIDPEIIEKYRAVEEELKSIKDNYKKMTQFSDSLAQLKKKGAISVEKEEKLEKSLKTKDFLYAKLQSLQNEIEILEPKIQERNDGKIKAYNVIYPGVKITIGSIYTYLREEKKYCCVVSEHAEIKFNPY